MSAADFILALLAALAAHWAFWLVLALALAFVTLASLACFEEPKRWARAIIFAVLAFDCAFALTLGVF